MATSPNYSWTEPDDTGLVKDGALAMRTLGNAIDSTVKSIDDTTLKTNANGTTTGSLTAARFIPSGTTIPTNGIYLPAANQVGIATNSTMRMTIDSAGLIAGAGTSLGTWTAYTATLTNITQGDGTISAQYAQVGKTVFFRVRFTMGSTSAVTGRIGLGLPVTARFGGAVFACTLVDSSPLTIYSGFGNYSTTSECPTFTIGTNGAATATSATNPFTWASGDYIQLMGSYEAA